MLIADLVPYAKSAVNGPGGEFVDADDEAWEVALANAFWTARLRGYFPDFRLDADDIEILNPDDPGHDFPREFGQIIVLYTVMNAIESAILALPTMKRAKAGPVESETQRSAQVLVQLLKQKRQDLVDLRDDLVAVQGPVIAGFADLILTRLDNSPVWVR